MARPTPTPATGSHDIVDRVTRRLAVLDDPTRPERQAFRVIHADTALQEAEASARRHAQGLALGPLDGCILSVKDLFDEAGEVTIAGAPVRASAPPAQTDATAVQRLKQAGAIIIGRTHMSEFAFSGIGINAAFGTPGNPRDATRIPGGSSSGAAASVGYGMCDIGLGSDTGGSVRIPAALCGLTGFKPTSGHVPLDGAFPLSPTLDTIGPIARTVAECAHAFAVLSDRPGLLPPTRSAARLSRHRLGIIRTDSVYDGAEPAVLAAMRTAEQALRAAGATPVDVDITDILDGLAHLDGLGLFPAIELAAILAGLSPAETRQIDPRIWSRVVPGYAVSATTYLAMQEQRRVMIARMSALMAGYDALLLPTVPVTAPRIDSLDDDEAFRRTNGLLLRNTRIGNLLDLPSSSLPIPTDELPVGLMLWGARGQDKQVLLLSHLIESALAGRPPATL
ncbi:amidase [Gluconacetobacter azotocaptans]|uniref:Amidase n=1 Tax=Gluconacetobacter azotocaptans TaxID=142834 RepID=A0A7W4JT48_9PROT|nr:amidase family protein [Gluconacetobacter azotocaptans]MBB2190295.1 amidase [Gluconacetobacter azotocaptans]GBQ27413.1 glutamyl-tRNA amidotransferase subunit A [Gluconacetobacter azotocaptans DSM 13594]